MDKQISFRTGSLEKSLERGEELVKRNKFYNDLATLLENPEITFFFEKYFNNWDDIKTIIMYIELYVHLNKWIKNKYITIDVVDAIIKNSQTRKMVVNQMEKLIKGERVISKNLLKPKSKMIE